MAAATPLLLFSTTGSSLRHATLRDGVRMWQIAREERGGYAPPTPYGYVRAIMESPQTSSVIEDGGEVVAFLLARRIDGVLRIKDVGAAEGFEGGSAFALLQSLALDGLSDVVDDTGRLPAHALERARRIIRDQCVAITA